MSLSSILALVDQDHGRATLRVAGLAAAITGAPVRGLAIRPDPVTAIPIVGPGGFSGDIVQQATEYAEIEGKREVAAARQVFNGWRGDAEAECLKRVGPTGQIVALEGRVHGMTVLLCGGVAEGETAAIDAALFATGRPTLIAPLHEVDAMGQRVAVFWKESPEAAKAVWSAMPFLKQAEQVRAFTVDEDDGAAASLSRLKEGLAYVDLEIETDCVAPSNKGASVQLVDKAAEMSADLVVMGAFSHSRLRELVLGGVTRNMLQTLARPTFMAH